MDQQQFNRIGRALADPRRMQILERIGREAEVAGATLANGSAVSPPTISHHLKELPTAGLIKPPEGSQVPFLSGGPASLGRVPEGDAATHPSAVPKLKVLQ